MNTDNDFCLKAYGQTSNRNIADLIIDINQGCKAGTGAISFKTAAQS